MSRSQNTSAHFPLKYLTPIEQGDKIACVWQEAVSHASKLINHFSPHKELIVIIYEDQDQNYCQYSSITQNIKWQDDGLAFAKISRQLFNSSTHIDTPLIETIGSANHQPHQLAGLQLNISFFKAVSFLLVRQGIQPFSSSDYSTIHFVAEILTLVLENHYMQSQHRQIDLNSQLNTPVDDLLATIAHEIRGPLGHIKGYTTTLLRSGVQWTLTEQQDLLNIIDLETDHMIELMDTLLDSARMLKKSDQLQMNIERIQLEKIVFESVRRAKILYPEVEFDTHLSLYENFLPVEGDSRLLMRVLDNILSNAIKYAPGSKIIVNLFQDHIVTTVLIEDFGPGIPEQYQPYLFTRFFRVPENSSQVHGSGLGLYICKQIISAHYGNIVVESKTGKGSKFQVILPNKQPDSMSGH